MTAQEVRFKFQGMMENSRSTESHQVNINNKGLMTRLKKAGFKITEIKNLTDLLKYFEMDRSELSEDFIKEINDHTNSDTNLDTVGLEIDGHKIVSCFVPMESYCTINKETFKKGGLF